MNISIGSGDLKYLFLHKPGIDSAKSLLCYFSREDDVVSDI
jgi:hypothetical protein